MTGTPAMDFGHDERFYAMMRDAAAEHAREFPNAAAYSRHLRSGPVQTRDRRARFEEYRECMRHADELERRGVKRLYLQPSLPKLDHGS